MAFSGKDVLHARIAGHSLLLRQFQPVVEQGHSRAAKSSKLTMKLRMTEAMTRPCQRMPRTAPITAETQKTARKKTIELECHLTD